MTLSIFWCAWICINFFSWEVTCSTSSRPDIYFKQNRIVLILGDIYDPASNFKGQIVLREGECCKFTLWFKPWDIIEKVNQPTNWVSSILVVSKPPSEANWETKIHISLDPRDLNMAIKHEHFPMPTIGNCNQTEWNRTVKFVSSQPWLLASGTCWQVQYTHHIQYSIRMISVEAQAFWHKKCTRWLCGCWIWWHSCWMGSKPCPKCMCFPGLLSRMKSEAE